MIGNTEESLKTDDGNTGKCVGTSKNRLYHYRLVCKIPKMHDGSTE